ncbi:hypothetical protein ACWEH1_30385 [Micromonospora chersina]
MLRIDGPDLGRIVELNPRVLSGTAAVLARHLTDEDEIVRGQGGDAAPPRAAARSCLPARGER